MSDTLDNIVDNQLGIICGIMKTFQLAKKTCKENKSEEQYKAFLVDLHDGLENIKKNGFDLIDKLGEKEI